MAVPKKKTSKSKRNSRKANWKRKAALEAQKALSLGKSVLTGRSNSFVYPQDEENDDEQIIAAICPLFTDGVFLKRNALFFSLRPRGNCW